MFRKTVSSLMLILLVVGILTVAFRIQPVKAEGGTIIINADGSISPSTAPIYTADNITYTLTGNITANYCSEYNGIVIERDNIVLDGAGYTVTLNGSGNGIGIFLSGSSNVTVRNAIIENFTLGIFLSGSTYNTLYGNTVTNNQIGIWVDSSSGNILSGNNINANNGNGIELHSSDINVLCGNTVANNLVWGIYLQSSSGNTLFGNNITNNSDGVDLDSSSGNTLSGNDVTANGIYGFLVDSSSGNTLSGNNIANNFEGIGIGLDVSSGNTLSGNNVVNDDFGIFLDSSSDNNTLSGNNVTASSYNGITLQSSSGNTLFGNNATANSEDGISLESSSGNTLSGNNVASNGEGIYLESSSYNNLIFHNNFANNLNVVSGDSVNTWDNGYPSGGNYWSDYTGVDVKSGPYQNETGSDGIGDTPYVIDANDIDYYPLMNPFSTSPFSVTISPSSATLDVGQSQLFTSTISGGTLPYSYQWYLNGSAVAGANFSNWTFTPSSSSSYTVYVNVTDNTGFVTESNTAIVTVDSYVIVTNITANAWIYQGTTANINVTVSDIGGFPENAWVTLYYNTTAGKSVDAYPVNLGPGQSYTLVFRWNTAGVPCLNYTLTAVATVPTGSNTLSDGTIAVRLLGDVNGDGRVDMKDIALVARALGSTPSSPNWNPAADILGIGTVNMRDIAIVARNFGSHT